MSRVCLVVPPILAVARPNLGVGLLTAILKRAGISCDVIYANITFAARLGCDYNELIAEKIDSRPLLAEWMFSWALYPERDSSSDCDYVVYARQHISDQVIGVATNALGWIPDFVTDTATEIMDKQPAIVGISSSFQQNTAALALARALKARRPGLVICLGGANCEGPMGEAIARNFPFVDRVFSGESDDSFLRFVQATLAGDQASKARVTYGAPVTDLDALPVPDYAEYFATLRRTSLAAGVRPTLVFEGSRGCWWGAKHHCKFCGLNGTTMAYRAKSPDRIRNELSELNRRWSTGTFMAADNILDHKTLHEIFTHESVRDADGNPRYTLFYEVKSNLNYDQLAKMADGGVRWVQPGIESLDDEILAIMDKGVSGLLNVRLLRNCAELGIVPIWNLLRGFPGEVPRHYSAAAALVPLIEHLSPPRGPFPIRLDRFSPYFEKAEEYGFHRPGPMRGYSAIYQLPEAEIRDLAYFYEAAETQAEPIPELEAWAQSVAKWRERHFSKNGPPVLSLVEIQDMGLLRDTRRCSTAEYSFVDETELRLLRHFRDPRSVEVELEKLAASGEPSLLEFRSSFEKLAKHGVLVVDKGKALSVALDYAFSRGRPETQTLHPFGEWRPEHPSSGPTGPHAFNQGVA
jgi:magnesium-protoporphyrin IX monomethyl ester (oxidative) cyclase